MWEDRYAESERIWSGRPNDRLVEVVSGLTPGRALDLGCGEGGDAVWLAGHGWWVTAVDIADTALQRTREAAGELADRIDLQRHDLTRTFPEGQFDLVSAHFLHSPTGWDRDPLMQRAAALPSSCHDRNRVTPMENRATNIEAMTIAFRRKASERVPKGWMKALYIGVYRLSFYAFSRPATHDR